MNLILRVNSKASLRKTKKTKLISTIDCNFIELLFVNSGTFGCWENDQSHTEAGKYYHKEYLIQTLLGIQNIRT